MIAEVQPVCGYPQFRVLFRRVFWQAVTCAHPVGRTPQTPCVLEVWWHARRTACQHAGVVLQDAYSSGLCSPLAVGGSAAAMSPLPSAVSMVSMAAAKLSGVSGAELSAPALIESRRSSIERSASLNVAGVQTVR